MQVRHIIEERSELRRRALMANACARGRPVAALVLSAQERTYLETQVRRHRVARSLSERCRVILRCADGWRARTWLPSSASTSTRLASGVAVFRKIAARVFLTRPAPADLERSMTIRLLP